MRRLTSRRLRLRRRRHVRRLTGRRLCRGGRRSARPLLLWSGLRGGRRVLAGRCVGGWRPLLAGRPRGGRSLSRALAGRPLVLVFVVRRWRNGLCKANSVRGGRRKRQLGERHGDQNCGAEENGIACHSIPRPECEVVAMGLDAPTIYRRKFVIRHDHATCRPGSPCKRRQPVKTAASVADRGTKVSPRPIVPNSRKI